MKTAKKTVLIIGGSGGIGSAAARTLVDAGFRVCITYFSDTARARKVIASFPRGAVQGYPMDAADETSVRVAMADLRTAYPVIDAVVFAPTKPVTRKPLELLTVADYRAHLDLQVGGMLSVARNLLPQLKAKHPIKFIVVLTEYCIGKPPVGLSDYVTAKYALMGLSKTMAVELARYGATCNMVSPGLTDTELLKGVPPKFIEMAAFANPMRRIGAPTDVAGVIAFLASDAAGYLNGAHITVNGGSVMQ